MSRARLTGDQVAYIDHAMQRDPKYLRRHIMKDSAIAAALGCSVRTVWEARLRAGPYKIYAKMESV